MTDNDANDADQAPAIKRLVGMGRRPIVTDPVNQKQLLAGSAMKSHRQKTLRQTDIAVERQMPLLAGRFAPGVVVADNDPTDPGEAFDYDPVDPVIRVDLDPRDGVNTLDFDIVDP